MKILGNDDFPLVSIVIPTYNRGNMLEQAIRSAIEQNYSNFEIVVSDNCSTDNTIEVLEKFAGDSRIKFFRNETNIGMFANFDKVINSLAQGKYFVNLCSDDALCYNEFISDAVKLIKKNEDVIIVFGKSYIKIDGELREGNNGNLYDDEFKVGKEVFLNFSGKESLGWEGVLIERKYIARLDIFKHKYTGFDLSCNLQLLLLGNACFVKKHCYVYNLHLGQASIELTAEQSLNNFSIIDHPYQFALSNDLIDRDSLDKWRCVFLQNRGADIAKTLYKFNRIEFKRFISELENRYGLTFKDLKRGFRTRLVYALFYFPVIGKLVLSLRNSFFKMKNH